MATAWTMKITDSDLGFPFGVSFGASGAKFCSHFFQTFNKV
jgi:hypothetical protein